jgi:hypothetical protein
MRIFMKKMAAVGGLATAILTAAPAFAHHSFAMFDREKSVTLEGAVKEFQWTNPHCWVQLMVLDPATGQQVEWSLEGLGPNGLSRQGWTRTSLKPGDLAVIVMHPMLDGKPGGELVTVTVGGQQLVNRANNP